MPIHGDLDDFPLPEVLLLIGTRTGCLRLYDVPDCGIMELHLSEGSAYALQLGGTYLMEDREIVTQLSVVIGTGAGLFEFYRQPLSPVRREIPLPLSQLVMYLVLYVDEVLAKQRALRAGDTIYAIQNPVPEIWIDPSLDLFFQQCQKLLGHGTTSTAIARSLGLEKDDVELNLTYLRQLGFVKLLDAEAMRGIKLEQDIAHKRNEFQLAAEASALIRRTGSMFRIKLGEPREDKAKDISATLPEGE